MDINGTKFHLLTGENDWEALRARRGVEGLWWDRERQSLALLPQILQYGQRQIETVLEPAQRRGAACDCYGNIFWIDENGSEIKVMPAGTEEVGNFWFTEQLLETCVEEEENSLFRPEISNTVTELPTLSAMCITCQHYMIVGTLKVPGLLVFDLHAGGRPEWIRWPEATVFSPLDMCADSDGGVWILDRNIADSKANIWKLDRHLRLVSINGQPQSLSPQQDAPFQPQAGDGSEYGTRYLPPATILNHGLPIDVHKASAVDCLGDGSVLIMAESGDETYSVIHRYLAGVQTNRIELKGGILDKILTEPKLLLHDFAFSAETTKLSGTIYGILSAVVRNGNQAFAFELLADGAEFKLLSVLPRYLPLRRFSGKALLATPNGIQYDMGQRWYPLTEQPRRRYISEESIDGLVLDGKEPGCVWHRIIIDGCIPDNTSIQIYTRADDEPRSLAYHEWQKEPRLVLRSDGSEILMHEPFNTQELQYAATGSWELLLQNVNGRYLELRLDFKGNGQVTPRIRAMRVYYPRFSYLNNYLPEVYRENVVQANFLERYLANTEAVFSKLESRIANFQHMLDTRTAPAEYLPWLAAWLGTVLNQGWSEVRQRLFIDNAVLLFNWRGTQIGMRALIRLAIEPCIDESIFEELRSGSSNTPIGGAAGASIRIIEHFLYRQLPGVVIGDPTASGGLRMTSTSNDLSELGKPWTLNSRYQEFLLRRYSSLITEAQPYALEILNTAWHTSFEDFRDIVFSTQIPDSSYQRPDWMLFVQRELATVGKWQPEQGVWSLHIRYQEWLRKHYQANHGEQALAALNEYWQCNYMAFEEIRFSPLFPQHKNQAEDWQGFIQKGLGFNYAAVTIEDTSRYQEFLARRYRDIDTLNRRYELQDEQAWASFRDISLPAEDAMPAQSTALHDWIQFVSLNLPIHRNAHHFTVLVPTVPGELPSSRENRLQQVEEIVRTEKPAHTQFDVRLYWALFQVGSARLGLDTTIGSGSRYVAVVLGSTYLGQGVLEHGHPWNINQRQVIGRDRIQRSIQGENNNE